MYFVTVLERLQENSGFPDFGDTRTVFFSANEEYCLDVLKRNSGDIYEYMYDYALLEWLEEDFLYCVSNGRDWYKERRKWFQWSPELKGYVQIEEPEFVKYAINISLG